MPKKQSRQRDIDGLILHIRGLVRAREQRRQAGAGRRELDLRNAEIARMHTRLADRVRRALHAEGAGR